MNKIIIKEEDNSFLLGIVIGIIFTIPIIIYLFSSLETKEKTSSFIVLSLFLAIVGYLFAFYSKNRCVEFCEDYVIYKSIFKRERKWRYSDIGDIRIMKKAFIIYDSNNKRKLLFEANLNNNEEVIELLKKVGILI